MSDWAAFPEVSPPPGPTRITVRPPGVPDPATDSWDAFPEASSSIVADVAKSLGTGAVKGAISTIGLSGDLDRLIGAGVSWIGRKIGIPNVPTPQELDQQNPPRILPTSDQVTGAVENAVGPVTQYQPQTAPGHYAETVGEFLPAAAAGPGGLLRRLVTGAVVPGVASEAAGQATQGTAAEPYARAAAALTAGALGILASGPGTATQAVRWQLPDYVTPAHVTRAQALIDHATRQGVNITWPEALSRVTGRPVLTDMQRILESTPRTRPGMQDFFADRSQQIEAATRRELTNVAPAPVQPSTVGPGIGAAAESSLNDVRGAINRAAEPFYRGSEAITLTPQEMARVRALPGYADAAEAVRNDPQLNRYVAHLPENSIGFLNEVKKYLDQQGQNAARPLAQSPNMQRAAGFGRDAAAARDLAANAARDPSRQYATALAVESVGRERYLNPLLRGPLGRLADKDLTTREAINALFPPNPLANSSREIGTTVSALAARNPAAASQLVRAHIESVFNEATQNLQGGANQFGGAKFAARLVGNPQQRANLEAAIRALPNGDVRWAGMNRLLDIVEATGTRQAKGSLTAFNAEELRSMAAGGHIAETVKTAASPGKWWSVVHDKWSAWQYGRNLDGLARIITDPNSADLFRRLAAAPPNSAAAGAAAARLILIGDAATAKERGRRNGPAQNAR